MTFWTAETATTFCMATMATTNSLAVLVSHGDVVRIMEGPFTDLIGRFAGSADNDRVLVLLDLLGRQVRTTLSQAAVEP